MRTRLIETKPTAAAVRERARKAGLPSVALTPLFVKMLAEAKHDGERDRLILERRKFLGIDRNGRQLSSYGKFAAALRDDDDGDAEDRPDEDDDGYEEFREWIEASKPRTFADFVNGLTGGDPFPDDEDDDLQRRPATADGDEEEDVNLDDEADDADGDSAYAKFLRSLQVDPFDNPKTGDGGRKSKRKLVGSQNSVVFDDEDFDDEDDEGGSGRRLSEAEFERANAAAFGDDE